MPVTRMQSIELAKSVTQCHKLCGPTVPSAFNPGTIINWIKCIAVYDSVLESDFKHDNDWEIGIITNVFGTRIYQ